MFRPVLPSAQRHVKLSGHASFTVTPVDELRELRHLVQSSAISRPHRSTRRLLIAGVPCTCRGLWETGFEWVIMRAPLMLPICFCTNNSENSYIMYRWDSRTFHSFLKSENGQKLNYTPSMANSGVQALAHVAKHIKLEQH